MPIPTLVLWANSSSGSLASGWQSLSNANPPILKQGDTIGVEVHWVTNSQGVMSEVEFPPSVAMTLAVGSIETAPTAGFLTLTYATQTTATLAYSATATQVQTALNALSSITAEGGVTVTKLATSYRIVWNNKVVPSSTITVGSNELYPSSTVGINSLRTGSLTQTQSYQLHIKQSPIAELSTFVTQTTSTASISVIHAAAFTGDSKVWRVSIDPQPKDGAFLLEFQSGSTAYTTNSISIRAGADAVKASLDATFNASWVVTKTGRFSWDISTNDPTVINLTVNGGGIISFNSKYGLLSLNTAEVEDFLAGNRSAVGTMELEVEVDGTRQTIFQSNCTILNDLIDSDNYTVVQRTSVMPVESVVRYDTSQSLSSAQKLQARTNIGAIDSANFAALEAKDTELEGRIIDLEGVNLSSTQLASITGAASPSGTNVLVSTSALTSALTAKANTNHTHSIGDVTNLLASLDEKANVLHSHAIADISGLPAALADKVSTSGLAASLSLKADTGHNHLSLEGTILTDPTVNKVMFTNGDTMIESPIGGYSTNSQDLASTYAPNVLRNVYPLEIDVQIGGVWYKVPARAL